MPDREKVVKGLEQFRADIKPFCGNHADWKRFDVALALLKEQEAKTKHCNDIALEYAKEVFRLQTLLKEQPEIVRCKDCSNWIPGYITDDDDFIPPKCGKYQQMVGHSADDYCSLAERE